jgi:hypothetical protein
VFDENNVDVTSTFDWLTTYKVKFLIQVFGAFAYENQGNKRVKLVLKLQQMKLYEMWNVLDKEEVDWLPESLL